MSPENTPPHRDFQHILQGVPRTVRRDHRAFTLIELMVVIAIIGILMGLLSGAIVMLRNNAKKSQAVDRVTQLTWVVQNYASEDTRHRFPPQTGAADYTIRYDPEGVAPGNFNPVFDLDHRIDLTDFDKSGTAPRAMLDPWGRPYQYMVDSDLIANTTAQRPLGVDGRTPPLDAWNATGIRPYAYIWSNGPRGRADGTDWIYQRDTK